MISVGASRIEMPQSANFLAFSGLKMMSQLSTGASGMRCLILSTFMPRPTVPQ